jgi:hypothetical protein
MQEAKTPLQMGNRFEVSRLLRGTPPRLQPLIYGALDCAGGGQMMRQKLWLALDEISEMVLQHPCDAGVHFPAPCAQ